MPALGRAIPATAAGPASLAALGAVAALGSLFAGGGSDHGWTAGPLLLAAGIILAALPVRLPGSVLAFLPGVLIPSWLALGLVATALLAVAATLIGGVIRRSRPELIVLSATTALAGVFAGDLGGRAMAALVSSVGSLPAGLSEGIVLGAGFALGFWLAERAILWVAGRTPFPGDLRRLPRASLVANLLLAWPSAILVDVLQARGVLLFGLLLALLVAALVLIALYLGAETERWG